MDIKEEEICLNLAYYIRMKREEKGLTQEEAAEFLNVTQRTIQRLEKGEGTKAYTALKNLKDMADFGNFGFLDFLLFLIPKLESELHKKHEDSF